MSHLSTPNLGLPKESSLSVSLSSSSGLISKMAFIDSVELVRAITYGVIVPLYVPVITPLLTPLYGPVLTNLYSVSSDSLLLANTSAGLSSSVVFS